MFAQKTQDAEYEATSMKMGDRIVSSGKNDVPVIDKVMDLEIEIAAKQNELIEKQMEIVHSIHLVYNPKLITVLINKYITGMTIEQIAETMNISRCTCLRMARSGITDIP